MALPEMPWYGSIERGLRPIEPYSNLVLIGLAALTVLIAWKGDSVTKMAWIVYLVSP